MSKDAELNSLSIGICRVSWHYVALLWISKKPQKFQKRVEKRGLGNFSGSFLISAWSITYVEWGLGKLLATTEIFVYLTVFTLSITTMFTSTLFSVEFFVKIFSIKFLSYLYKNVHVSTIMVSTINTAVKRNLKNCAISGWHCCCSSSLLSKIKWSYLFNIGLKLRKLK